MTLFRLVLNTATTCLILSNGRAGTAAAGHVIEQFAAFVASGSLAVVFPGQGSQSVGMMNGFASNAAVMRTFAEAREIIGLDYWKMAAEGPPGISCWKTARSCAARSSAASPSSVHTPEPLAPR